MYFPFGKDWSTLHKLIWLKAILNAQKKRQQEQERTQDTKTTTGE